MLAELTLLCLLAGGSAAGEPPPPAAASSEAQACAPASGPSRPAAPPDPDPALALAESFRRSGAFEQAVTEYKRFLFFHPEDSRAAEARSGLGFCLLAEGRTGEGLAALRLAAAGQPGLDCRLDLVRALLETGRQTEAELELLQLQAFAEGAPGEIALYLGVLRIEQGRWEEAGEALRQALPEADLQLLDGLLAEAGKRKRKSPRAARLLSALLPGAGQAYAGDVPDGLNALAVNGGIAVLAAAAAVNGYYPEAVLLVLFPLRRYYTGNIGNAGRLAERRNAEAREGYRRLILEELLEVRGGLD
jgi:tetratricopeptide (TPR) repeat protein